MSSQSTLLPGPRPFSPSYEPTLEAAVSALAGTLSEEYRLSRRSVALLLLQGDEEIERQVRETEGDRFPAVAKAVAEALAPMGGSADTAITLQRHAAARSLAEEAITRDGRTGTPLAQRLSRLTTSPITGLPILALVVWFGLYQFVGIFGGGTLVGLLEHTLFGDHINPWMTGLVQHLIPWRWLSDLFVGEYGMWTLGVTYATALIFPIVGTFFLAFSVLEDSGYLPRLAMLVDRLFKAIGLSGKAVIPIVLGFGCDTMATLVTRILETPRERLIATFLLSLAIPCSAQIGVMAALLAGHSVAFGLWAGVMAGIFVVIGYLTSKLLPGETARFAMELPPLRLPSLSNVAVKTLSRMQWYFLEVFPLFLLASVMIWLGQLTGVFGVLVKALGPMVRLMGLPDASAEAFLFGFFRRDYGAAGLYRLQQHGGLNGNQLLISVVALTIFLPCVAQFLMIKKECGGRMAVAMALFIFPFAVVVGTTLNLVLSLLGVRL
ncbi:MAG TPA: ferrous iron transporter B [Armatimonadota bacterium]|jgi:ferrous iron transport protein B